MASSIGSINFIKMTGPQVPKLAAAVTIVDRPGTDGTINRVDELKAEEITVYTLEGINTLSNAKNAIDTYSALKGTNVTVVDDNGRSTADVLVVDVRVLRVQSVLNPQPVNNNYLVRAAWLLKPTKV